MSISNALLSLKALLILLLGGIFHFFKKSILVTGNKDSSASRTSFFHFFFLFMSEFGFTVKKKKKQLGQQQSQASATTKDWCLVWKIPMKTLSWPGQGCLQMNLGGRKRNSSQRMRCPEVRSMKQTPYLFSSL